MWFPPRLRLRLEFAALHLQGWLSAFFYFDGVGELWVCAAEAGAETPVVEVAEVAFEGRVDEVLVVFFGERADG